MWMMRLARAVIGAGLIVGVSTAPVQDDHETTVRLAYAKLTFICQIGGIHAVYEDGDASALRSDVAQRRLQQRELRFTIKDLRTVKLSDLKKSALRFSSLVTPPEPPVLRVSVGTPNTRHSTWWLKPHSDLGRIGPHSCSAQMIAAKRMCFRWTTSWEQLRWSRSLKSRLCLGLSWIRLCLGISFRNYF